MDETLVEAAALIRRGANGLDRRLRAERPDDGIALTKLSVLGHLARKGPLTAGELAGLDRVQPQSLTRTLSALETDGYVVRTAGRLDRRQAVLEITDAGAAALAHNVRARDVWLARAMAEHLTATEREVLRLAGTLMQRLADLDMPVAESMTA